MMRMLVAFGWLFVAPASAAVAQEPPPFDAALRAHLESVQARDLAAFEATITREPRMTLIRRTAEWLAAQASRALPPDKADWARAMTHELAYVHDDVEALKWALGVRGGKLLGEGQGNANWNVERDVSLGVSA